MDHIVSLVSRGGVLLLSVLLGTFSAGATQYFVDRSRPDDTGDGLTEATAKRTIQAAVDAASKNDVVTVLPGVYDEGVTVARESNNRIVITKNITLRSRDGAAVTHIVGQHDPASESGLGVNAVRCVLSEGVSPLIQGFTIRNGASHTDQSGSDACIQNKGGGILSTASNQDVAVNPVVVDCVISNCAATRGGGIFRGHAYWCLFDGNRASNNGEASRHSTLANCIFVRNTATSGAKTSSVVSYPGLVLNCTFVDNDGSAADQGMNGYGPIMNCLLARNEKNEPATSTFTNCLLSASPTYGGGNIITSADQIVAPALDDWRLIAGSAAAGAGDPDCLRSVLTLYGETDFYGNPRTSNGRVNIGAVESVVPVFGKMTVETRSDVNISLEGHPVTKKTYAFATAYPTQYLASAVSTVENRAFLKFYVNGVTQWPLMNDTLWLLSPKAGEEISVYGVTGPALYVDAASGSDETGDGSAAAPYQTLQKTVDSAAGENTVILAGPGRYDRGERFACGCSNRLVIGRLWSLKIRAVEGPEKTFIVGASDPNSPTGDGRGPAAVRCLAMPSFSVVQGFTLTGGRSGVSENDVDEDKVRAGGAFGASSSIVMDSVISNCVASRGAASWCAYLNRCRIIGNTAVNNGITRGCIVRYSLFSENTSGSDILGLSTSAYGCTLVNNIGQYGISRNTQTRAVNSVIYGQRSGADANGAYITNCVYGNYSWTSASFGDCLKADPLFAAVNGPGDGVLLSATPARHVGSLDFLTSSDAGLDGTRLVFTDGAVLAGAQQNTAPAVTVSSSGGRGISPSGVIPVTTDGFMSFTATDVGVRRFLGFEVDGEAVPDCGATLTIPVSSSATGRLTTVTAVYQNVCYADAVNGDDARDGFSPETAKRTLQAAVELCVDGDTVIAAPGRYNEGSGLQTITTEARPGAPYIRARVVVTNSVTLVSRDGAETTVIVGASAKTDPDADGLGPDAMRGVYLANGAVVRGFTITGGRTDRVNAETDDNNHGGGVLVLHTSTASIENCIISNNVSVRGGGGRSGNYINCKILENKAINNSCGVRDGRLYQCLLARNRGNFVTGFCPQVERCTIAADNTGIGGEIIQPVWGDSFSEIRDTLIEGTGSVSGGKYFNCAYPPALDLSTAATNEAPSVGDVTLDAMYRPAAFSNAAVDAAGTGDSEMNTVTNDLAGLQRVMNGARDCGCYEYDWRPRYSADLCRNGSVAVTDVTPSVVETEDRSVALLDGTVSAKWTRRGSSRMIVLRYWVTDGTLEIKLNGEVLETVSATDGWVERRTFSSGTENTFVFTHKPEADGTGGARLGGFLMPDGSMLLLR